MVPDKRNGDPLANPFDAAEDADEEDRLFEERRAKRAEMIPEHAEYIEQIAWKYGSRINIPEGGEREGRYFPDEKLESALWDAAVSAPAGDDEAIRKAIHDRLQHCIDTYGMKE